MTIFRFDALISLVLLLGACSEKISDEGLICEQSPGLIQGTATDSSGQLELVNQCIHKFGYRFGRSSGTNREIADAVIGRCRESLDNFLSFKVEEGNKSKEPFVDSNWKVFEERFREEALRRVVEGRAGQCSIRGVDQK